MRNFLPVTVFFLYPLILFAELKSFPYDGCYSKRHSVIYFDKTAQYRRISKLNGLYLKTLPDGRVRTGIFLTFSNYYVCQFTGTGRWDGKELVVPDPYPELRQFPNLPPCELTINFTDDLAVISESKGSCQDYCGAGGTLDGAVFPLSRGRRACRPNYLNKLLSSQ
ncbi:MAG: hypothetical protein D6719_05380 [Candidatus Dadabacteria bacterium]|nr:MAG: hypothetical protein D6719_05380 [Candidatus Dadabacteria bacterium]